MTNDDSDAHQLIADRVVQRSEELKRPIEYIEVGVHVGNSAAAVLGTFKVAQAILIDNFSDSSGSKAQAEATLRDYNGLFLILVEDSKLALPRLLDGADHLFDIGLVDGDHSATSCMSDMTNMLRLLRRDGIMFVHDLTNPDFPWIEDVVTHFAGANDLSMIFHKDVHNALAELRRN